MVYLDVGVAHQHEVDLHSANHAATYKRAHEPHENVVLIFPHTIIHLAEQFVDIRLLSIGDVRLEQAGQCAVDGRTDEVATCASTMSTIKRRTWRKKFGVKGLTPI